MGSGDTAACQGSAASGDMTALRKAVGKGVYDRRMKKEARQSCLAHMRDQIMQNMEFDHALSDAAVLELIDRCIREEADHMRMPVRELLGMRQELFHSLRRLDLLSELLEDTAITEIMINGYADVYVEKGGRISRYPKGFHSEEKLRDVIQKVVSDCNRTVNEAHPIVDARLQDGSRVNVVLPPVALNGGVMTIRRFSKTPMTMDTLVSIASVTEEAAGLLALLVKSGYNIFISGGTGSGKTTFLNALSGLIPSTQRVITIEDAAELQLQGIPNLVRLESRNANVEGENAVSIKDLIKASLRMRPDRLIVGEVRDGAALDMLTAMNTGHDGSISTGHANSAVDMLHRLETMVLMAVDMPMTSIQAQIASAIDIVIHLGRLRDRRRCVLEICEVLGVANGSYQIRTLYRFRERDRQGQDKERRDRQEPGRGKPDRRDPDRREPDTQCNPGRVQGSLIWEQGLLHTEKLRNEGYYEAYQKLLSGHLCGAAGAHSADARNGIAACGGDELSVL